MRILYFSRDYTTHDRRFLLELVKTRHEFHFLRLEDDGLPYESRPLPDGVHDVAWPGGRHPSKTPEDWLRLMPDFEQVLERVRPDLVHAGPVQSCAYMAALADFAPLLTVSWGSDILVDADRDPLWSWLTRTALKRSQWFLCDCDAVREKALGFAPIPEDRIVQFPWGIDLESFQPGLDRTRLREYAGWQRNCVILSTRAWEPVYGIETLLEGFRCAYQKDNSLRLVLLGAGSEAPKVNAFLEDDEMDNAVLRPGMVSHTQLPDYFRAADVYVSCTHSDGSSISLLEVMATGLPAVVSDIPGNREWVENDVNGWRFPTGEPEALAEDLLKAANIHTSQRQAIAKANQSVTRTRANWQENIQKLIDAYDSFEDARDLGTP